MVERLFLALIILLVGIAVYRFFSRVVLLHRTRAGLLLEDYNYGRAAILYFSSNDCQPCRMVQKPALERIRERYGEGVQIIEIDALQRPDLADAWGVLSLPTTFIIDREGRPRGVNNGLAHEEQLVKQLQSVGEIPSRRFSPAPGIVREKV